MRRRRTLFAPVAFAAVAIGAGPCGSAGSKNDTSKFKGADKDVAQAVYDLRDAVAKRDEAKLCDSLMTKALADRIKADGRGSTCAKNVKDSIQDVDATDLKIESVNVSGTTATATIKTNLQGSGDPKDTLTFEKDAQGDWRLSAVGQG